MQLIFPMSSGDRNREGVREDDADERADGKVQVARASRQLSGARGACGSSISGGAVVTQPTGMDICVVTAQLLPERIS